MVLTWIYIIMVNVNIIVIDIVDISIVVSERKIIVWVLEGLTYCSCFIDVMVLNYLSMSLTFQQTTKIQSLNFIQSFGKIGRSIMHQIKSSTKSDPTVT